MRDFLPSDVRKRNYVIGIIKEVYESYGFEPLETPAVENIETLMGKYGDEGNQLIFKILKRGEKLEESLKSGVLSPESGVPAQDSRLKTQDSLSDLALRYDLTVPLARVVANNKNELPKFFKRYQIQPVWRADRPARGRFREFCQCDVDVIGSDSMVVEAELISAVSEILIRLGFSKFEVRINNRRLLESILNAAAVPEKKRIDALIALDKLDKIGRAGVQKEFLERGLGERAASLLLEELEYYISKIGSLSDITNDSSSLDPVSLLARLETAEKERDDHIEGISKFIRAQKGSLDIPRPRGTWWDLLTKDPDQLELTKLNAEQKTLPSDEIEKLKVSLLQLANENVFLKLQLFIQSRTHGIEGLAELSQVLEFCQDSSAQSHIRVDPSLARGLSYYTGTIMEINVPDLAGSLGGGGRYDGLIGMFGKEQIPACGFSLGLERILVVMDERNMFPPEIAASNSADVMVTIWNEETIAESLKLANELRANGLRVTVYPEADKLGKQMKYADAIKVPWVCVLGDSEIAENKVTLKNMASGEQMTVIRDEAASKIKK